MEKDIPLTKKVTAEAEGEPRYPLSRGGRHTPLHDLLAKAVPTNSLGQHPIVIVGRSSGRIGARAK